MDPWPQTLTRSDKDLLGQPSFKTKMQLSSKGHDPMFFVHQQNLTEKTFFGGWGSCFLLVSFFSVQILSANGRKSLCWIIYKNYRMPAIYYFLLKAISEFLAEQTFCKSLQTRNERRKDLGWAGWRFDFFGLQKFLRIFVSLFVFQIDILSFVQKKPREANIKMAKSTI